MSKQQHREQVPEPLQAKTIEARFIKREIWERLWRNNEHFMGVVVGREGSGKSGAGVKLAEVVDPTFNAERVVFDPASYIKKLREWKENDETQGKVIVIDEAGVGMGVRTWYDKDQIMLNQVLQIVRDENMGVIFTLPRLEELDSQTRGRLHAFIETMEKQDGDWLKLKWLDFDPTRDGRNKIYREYLTVQLGGVERKVKRLNISPATQEVWENYQERKEAFQAEQYDAALEEMEDDVEDERTVKEIAMDIADSDLSPYIATHKQTGEPYINKQLIRVEHETSHADAEAIKNLLERQFSTSQLEQYV